MLFSDVEASEAAARKDTPAFLSYLLIYLFPYFFHTAGVNKKSLDAQYAFRLLLPSS